MKYQIAGGMGILQTTQRIHNEMKAGWKPLGGISAVTDKDGDLMLYQAMTMAEENENYQRLPTE